MRYTDPTGESSGEFAAAVGIFVVGGVIYAEVSCLTKCIDDERKLCGGGFSPRQAGQTQALCFERCAPFLDLLGFNSKGALLGKLVK